MQEYFILLGEFWKRVKRRNGIIFAVKKFIYTFKKKWFIILDASKTDRFHEDTEGIRRTIYSMTTLIQFYLIIVYKCWQKIKEFSHNALKTQCQKSLLYNYTAIIRWKIWYSI